MLEFADPTSPHLPQAINKSCEFVDGWFTVNDTELNKFESEVACARGCVLEKDKDACEYLWVAHSILADQSDINLVFSEAVKYLGLDANDHYDL